MPLKKPVNVIAVTDGDRAAQRAVEVAARNVGARCISASGGNPTAISGEKLVELIKQAAHEPVVVMLDDRGYEGQGRGESALALLAGHKDINILGVLAVASNSGSSSGTHVHLSVDCRGNLVDAPVDKFGQTSRDSGGTLSGDTVELLDKLKLPVVVGIGDVGKMDGADDYAIGAPLTTKALREIITRSEYGNGTRGHRT